jgi:hypothetical protein
LAGDAWVPIPEDSSGIVVREYIADRDHETGAELSIDPLDPPGSPGWPDDTTLAEQLIGMAWTMAKLTTLHRTIRPELMETPNVLVTAQAAELGSADTTPDNLYMMGTFRLGEGEALVIDLEPPDTRYWSMTLENIWHECVDPRRRRSHVTNAGVAREADGSVRIVVAASDPGVGHWLDTGGRHRGFVVVRWLDNPDPPPHTTTVVPLTELSR